MIGSDTYELIRKPLLFSTVYVLGKHHHSNEWVAIMDSEGLAANPVEPDFRPEVTH